MKASASADISAFRVCMSGTMRMSPTVSPEICMPFFIQGQQLGQRMHACTGIITEHLPRLQSLWDDAHHALLAQAGVDCARDLAHQAHVAPCKRATGVGISSA